MLGLVQYHSLLLPTTLDHAAENFPETEIVSAGSGRRTRTNYRATSERARRLASALHAIGVRAGDFAGSLAWTTHRHLELFHAVPGVGAALHTANPRLPAAQIAAAINQCGYRVLFVDPETIALAEEIRPLAPSLTTFVVLCEAADLPCSDLPELIAYEDLIDAGRDDFVWPELDERTASTLCFTSGTTGAPKGVLYSHRGTLLNAMAVASANAWGLSSRDTVLAISPLFHCNGWGLPYLAPMTGAKLVLPGRDLSAAHLQRLIVEEGVTIAAAVPTVWLDLIGYCRTNNLGLGTLDRVLCGGSAPSAQLIETLYRKFGVRTIHAWGMTETTHGTTFSEPLGAVAEEADPPFTRPQGRPIYGSAIRAVGEDGRVLENGSGKPGRLQVRGHWMAESYFQRPDVRLSTADGWMETGDVGIVTAANEMKITDREKDVIKSGGEWISSQDLENAVVRIPGVAAAAVVGVPHPRWVERPLVIAVRELGGEITETDILIELGRRFPKWCVPDAVRFVDSLPLTPTGKVDKRALKAECELASASPQSVRQ